MKCLTALSAVILITISLGRATAMEQPYITPVNYPAVIAPGTSVTGQVTNIDPVNQMIQVKDAFGMLQTIHITPYFQILHNSETVKLTNLSLGDTVTVIAQPQ